MVASMTGFGRAEVNRDGITVRTEVRSVNSRYLDLTLRLPRNFSQREKEMKDIVRTFLNRGNLNIIVKVEHDSNVVVPLKVNKAAAKSYYKLLNEIRKSVKLREQVIRERGLGEPDRSTPGGALEPDARQAHRDVRILLQMRRGNVLVLAGILCRLEVGAPPDAPKSDENLRYARCRREPGSLCVRPSPSAPRASTGRRRWDIPGSNLYTCSSSNPWSRREPN